MNVFVNRFILTAPFSIFFTALTESDHHRKKLKPANNTNSTDCYVIKVRRAPRSKILRCDSIGSPVEGLIIKALVRFSAGTNLINMANRLGKARNMLKISRV